MVKCLRLGIILFLASAVLTTSGCEPLRKKFVRKKNIDTTEDKLGAIYDPIEYTSVVKTSAEIYSQHFNLWKVWLGDLMTQVSDNANAKKLQSTVTQMQEQLSAMRGLLNADSQRQVDEYLVELEKLKVAFQKPLEMRNKTALMSQIRFLDRRVKDTLALKKVKDQLLPVS